MKHSLNALGLQLPCWGDKMDLSNGFWLEPSLSGEPMVIQASVGWSEVKLCIGEERGMLFDVNKKYYYLYKTHCEQSKVASSMQIVSSVPLGTSLFTSELFAVIF